MKNVLSQGTKTTNKPNFLINIKRKGTLTSNRAYNQLLKIVLRDYYLGDKKGNQDNIFYISKEELKLACGTKKNQDIKEGLDILLSSHVEMVEYYDKKDKPEGADWKKMGKCVLLAAYQEEWFGEMIEFEIPFTLLNYLEKLYLEKRLTYTQLEDKFLTSLKKKHSLILYEKLKEHRGQFKLKISYNDLIELMGLQDSKSYKEDKIFKRSVLKPSLEEILKTTNLNFDWTTSKNSNISYLEVEYKKSKRELKGLLEFYPFIRTFRGMFQVLNREKGVYKGFTIGEITNQPLTINKEGYFAYQENLKEKFDKDMAEDIWNYLYRKYLENEDLIYKVLETNKEEFEEANYHIKSAQNPSSDI